MNGPIGKFLGRLRFPQLFLILAGLTVADALIPDVIPFVDEIGLALLTALFAAWKTRRVPAPTTTTANGKGAPPLPRAEGVNRDSR